MWKNKNSTTTDRNKPSLLEKYIFCARRRMFIVKKIAVCNVLLTVDKIHHRPFIWFVRCRLIFRRGVCQIIITLCNPPRLVGGPYAVVNGIRPGIACCIIWYTEFVSDFSAYNILMRNYRIRVLCVVINGRKKPNGVYGDFREYMRRQQRFRATVGGERLRG